MIHAASGWRSKFSQRICTLDLFCIITRRPRRYHRLSSAGSAIFVVLGGSCQS